MLNYKWKEEREVQSDEKVSLDFKTEDFNNISWNPKTIWTKKHGGVTLHIDVIRGKKE